MRPGPWRGERAAGAVLVVLGISLLLANVHPFGDAELFSAARTEAAQMPQSIPADARRILAADCADCHSSKSRVPAYGRFAPVSWLLERDITEARKHLNLGDWDRYDADRRQTLLAEIAQRAKTGQMPPPQYLLAHRGARLEAGDVAALLAWVHAAQASEAQPSQGSATGPADPARASAQGIKQNTGVQSVTADAQLQAEAPDAARGADLFNRRCTGCHTLVSNREGPRLRDVYGRAAASVAGFPYSAALKGKQITWNEETLDRWLTDPDAFVPGVNMDFRVPKAQERADIIAFLKQAR